MGEIILFDFFNSFITMKILEFSIVIIIMYLINQLIENEQL